MVAKLRATTVLGVDAFGIDVETQISGHLRKFSIVGLPDGAVRESRERVRCAIENSGFAFPDREVIVSLAPASLPKAGAGFDLAIALSILIADRQIPAESLPSLFILGELALDGAVKPVEGAIAAAALARAHGAALLIAAKNAPQASLVDGVCVYGVSTLRQAAGYLTGSVELESERPPTMPAASAAEDSVSFGDIVGQHAAKRALEIVAAGGHNVLFVGPPGAGKTMLARCLPSILPRLSREEVTEVTKIHSALSWAGEREGEINRFVTFRERPFRAPHHTTSAVGLVGGGTHASPGEISLAHRGVLFLDEFVEFRRDALESLRQPLESREIVITRAKARVVLPAAFTLITAMNPCPCGRRGSPALRCICSPGRVETYARKVSGPILERIDLQLWVAAVPTHELNSSAGDDNTSKIREAVTQARRTQRERFQTRERLNGAMRPRELREWCKLESGAAKFLEHAARKLSLSARGYSRVLKVSRTVADLEDAKMITLPHVSEALSYRLASGLVGMKGSAHDESAGRSL